jgi:hypothetical protein
MFQKGCHSLDKERKPLGLKLLLFQLLIKKNIVPKPYIKGRVISLLREKGKRLSQIHGMK